MASTRNENVWLAKVAGKSGCYEDMAEFMVKVVDAAVDGGEDLTVEERKLLYLAFTRVMEAHKASWQTILENEHDVDSIKEYRSKIEADMTSICDRVINLLDSKLIGSAASAESKAFYFKMKGEYYKYLADFDIYDDRQRELAVNCRSAYWAAEEIAKKEFFPAHPLRLDIALHFSLFCYDIFRAPSLALDRAKQAFDEAIPQLPSLFKGPYHDDSAFMLRLLLKKIKLWTLEVQELQKYVVDVDDDDDDDDYDADAHAEALARANAMSNVKEGSKTDGELL